MLQSDNMTSSTPVLLPQLGLEVTEGRVNAVLVEVGAQVTRDQPLVELETDKAVTDVVAPEDGVVASIEVTPGDTVPVGAVLLTLSSGDSSAPVQAGPAAEPAAAATNGAPPATPTAAPSATPTAAPSATPTAAPSATPRRPSRSSGRRHFGLAHGRPRRRVAPVARRAAAKLGVDLATVTGTGPRGRITLYDVEGAAATQAPAPPPTAARS